MVKRDTLSRTAFTLIELIFAIVVISAAVITLPVMIQITSRSIENNIVQEAIFAASAELMGATSYYWDANSMADSNVSRLSRVIDLDGDCDNNTSNPRYRLRPGHIAQPYHRRCLDATSPTSRGDAPSSVFPNTDNAVHGSDTIFTDTTQNAAGYKESYKSIVSVSYVNQTGAADANIKKITVRVTDSDDNNITVLNTYSANVGEIDYYKMRF